MSNPTIIIVDPNKEQRDRLKKILSKIATVFAVSNTQEALFEFHGQINKIQLLVISDQIKNMSVMSFMKEIENYGYVIPNFILLSAEENPDILIEYMVAAGAYDVLNPSSDDEVIKTTIQKALKVGRMDMLQFRGGAQRQNHWVFMESLLSDRIIKFTEEINFMLNSFANQWLQIPCDFMNSLNFAHGGQLNRKNYPLKLLLKELEEDTGEKASPPWRFKVLIIEDELPMLEGLKTLLKEEYLVFIAQTGQQGLDILKKHKDMDIVLLDIGLPDFSGVELIKKSNELYAEEESTYPFFIAVTAFFDADTIKEIARAGAVNYITKPFDSADLKKKIRTAAERQYYYKAVKELLTLLKSQHLSFRNRLILMDANVKRFANLMGFKADPDVSAFFPFFKEYCDGHVINLTSRFTGLSLQTNLKETVLSLQEKCKALKNVTYIPLDDDCGFKESREEKEEKKVTPSAKLMAPDEECQALNAPLLIVDDEEGYLSALKIILGNLSDKMYEATTGTAALDIIKNNPEILIVIVDMNLPDMSGTELLKKILDCYKTVHRIFPPRFIVLTAYDPEGMDFKEGQLGIYKVLSKGCEPEEIRNIVKEILSDEIRLQKVK